jgi:putative transposase
LTDSGHFERSFFGTLGPGRRGLEEVSVRRSRFSVEQIVAVLKQAELGMAVSELIRKIGISEQTFYRWKKQYGSLQPDQARELRQLQEENARLKKLVADLSLDKAILQDVATKKWASPR